jgi:uncharacterized protein YhaN
LPALVYRARRLAEHIDSVRQKRAELEGDVRKLTARLASARARAERAESEQARWRDEWARAIRPLGLGPDAIPAVVHEFLGRLGDLFERLKDARGFAERVEMIGHDANAFCGHVRELALQIDPPLAQRPCEQTAQGLVERLDAAKRDAERQATLLEEQKRYQQEFDQAAGRIEQLSAKLRAMCEEAGCQSPEALPQVEEASDTAARLRQTIRELEDQLLGLSAGATIDAFVSEVEAVDADHLGATLESLAGQMDQLETARGELRETIGSERKELEKMDAGTQAADAAEEAQHLLVQIRTDVEQYVRLRLASAVLRQAVERYQKKHEAPVLSRASALFRRLTLGSFQQLIADFDDRGEKVLMGDRGDGSRAVALAGMSDGTCDQLYLALRLASLENDLEKRGPIPFVVDDILVGFDDRRASAALEVLAELSRRTQVIFFTHHDHLVRLAQQSADADRLFVHHLPERVTADAAR